MCNTYFYMYKTMNDNKLIKLYYREMLENCTVCFYVNGQIYLKLYSLKDN